MGDNRYSKYYLGLRFSGIKIAFAAVLLSSVCFSNVSFAIITGDDVLASLKSGHTSLKYEGNYKVVVPVPGEAFEQSRAHWFDKTWLDSAFDITFKGDVTFYDATYLQNSNTKKDGWNTDFKGGVINNSGTVNFIGSEVNFGPAGTDENKDYQDDRGNYIVAWVNHSKDKGGPASVYAAGASVYNTGTFTTAANTITKFKDNVVAGGSVGYEDDAIKRGYVELKGGAMYNAKTADFGGDVLFENNYLKQLLQNTFYTYDEDVLFTVGDYVFEDQFYSSAERDEDGVLKDTSNEGKRFYLGYSDDVKIDNTTKNLGGAYYNAKDASTTFGGNVVFRNNGGEGGYTSAGGAVYNADGGKLIFKGSSLFEKNGWTGSSVSGNGGALYTHNGDVRFEGSAEFRENTALGGGVVAGAGLYQVVDYTRKGSVTFDSGVLFEKNKIYNPGTSADAVARGAGVYQSNGEITFNNIAIFNQNKITAEGKDSYGTGAGLHVIDDGVTTFNDDALFMGNEITASAFAAGAGLSNYSNVIFNANPNNEVTNITFVGNQVHNTQSDTDPNISLEKAEYVQSRGGAIYNGQGSITFGNNTKVSFVDNKVTTDQAKAFGGAVYNDVYTDNSGELAYGRMNFSGDAVFQGNEATTGGGAIFNKGEMVLNGNLAFEENKAQKGGAIYNDTGALLTIGGSKVTFTNNEAELGSNIYNLGTVNIQNVQDTMEMNYTQDTYPQDAHTLFDQTGDVYNEGTINIKNSSIQLHTGLNTKNKNKTGAITVENSTVDLGKSTVYTGTFDVNKGGRIVTHIKDDEHGQVVASEKINVSSADTSLRVLVGLNEIKKGEVKEYQFFKVEPDAATASTMTEGTNGVEGAFASLEENQLYLVKEKEGQKGVYEVQLREGASNGSDANPSIDLYPNCSNGNCSNYNKSASDAWLSSVIENNDEAFKVQTALNELAQVKGLHSDEYEKAMQSITPDASALITAHANEVTRQVANAISKRFYSSMERTHFTYDGKIHYKAPRHYSNVWVEGIYGQAEYDGKKKFDMDTMGVALGAEIPLSKELKIGAVYAYTTGEGSGVMRDTEVETHTGAVYAEYSPNRFYANGFALYGRSTVEESRSAFSTGIKAEYDVDIMAAQAVAGYKLGPVVIGNWVSGVLSPEVGLRYVYARQNEYEDSLGQVVEETDAHTLTGILGARYTIGYQLAPNMWLYPELRAALTYDFISPSMEGGVVLGNGASYTYETEEMDKFGIEIGLKMGLELDKRTEIGLEYEGLLKGDYTNHTGIANIKYHF